MSDPKGLEQGPDVKIVRDNHAGIILLSGPIYGYLTS